MIPFLVEESINLDSANYVGTNPTNLDKNKVILNFLFFDQVESSALCSGPAYCSACDKENFLFCVDTIFKLEFVANKIEGFQKLNGVLWPLSKKNCFDYDLSNPEHSVETCSKAGGFCSVDSCPIGEVCNGGNGCDNIKHVNTKAIKEAQFCPHFGYYWDPVVKSCVLGCDNDLDCPEASPYCDVITHECDTQNPFVCEDTDGLDIIKNGTLSFYPFNEYLGTKAKKEIVDFCTNQPDFFPKKTSNNMGPYLAEFTCDKNGVDKATKFVKCDCKDGRCTDPDITELPKQVNLVVGEPSGFIMDNEVYEVTLQETVQNYLRLKIKGKRLFAVRSFAKGNSRNLRLGFDKSIEVKVLDIVKNGALVSFKQLHAAPISRILGAPVIEEPAPTLDGTKAPVYDGKKVAPVSGGLGKTAGMLK